MYSTASWCERLDDIKNTEGKIIICTYSLPDIDYIERILNKRSKDVTIIANNKFKKKAQQIKNKFPDLTIVLRPDIHAKMALIEPETVWLASENFGKSGWFEDSLGIQDRRVYDHYYNQVLDYIWDYEGE